MSIEAILRLGDDTLLHNVDVSFKCKDLKDHEEQALSLRVNNFKMLSDDELKITFRIDDFQYVTDYLSRIEHCDIVFNFNNSKSERNIKCVFSHCKFDKKIPSILNYKNNEEFSYSDNSKPLMMDVLFKIGHKIEGF